MKISYLFPAMLLSLFVSNIAPAQEITYRLCKLEVDEAAAERTAEAALKNARIAVFNNALKVFERDRDAVLQELENTDEIRKLRDILKDNEFLADFLAESKKLTDSEYQNGAMNVLRKKLLGPKLQGLLPDIEGFVSPQGGASSSVSFDKDAYTIELKPRNGSRILVIIYLSDQGEARIGLSRKMSLQRPSVGQASSVSEIESFQKIDLASGEILTSFDRAREERVLASLVEDDRIRAEYGPGRPPRNSSDSRDFGKVSRGCAQVIERMERSRGSTSDVGSGSAGRADDSNSSSAR